MTAITTTGQTLAGRYELTRWVGGGAMGEVWEGFDHRMERQVAVKVLRPAHFDDAVALERFRIEAKLGAKLDHPGIAKVHDVNTDTAGGEPPWMVQDFIDGEPLTELIARSGPLDPGRAAAIIKQAAEAAHAAHQIGIVHRDLTPRNLLVGAADEIKVTDFGIARTSIGAGLTLTGHVIGTPAYLSPEQVRGSPVTPASDVYTLAVALYECLAGRRPFDGRNPIEVARAHLDSVPPPLPDSVPERLRETVSAAMAKDPARRPTAAVFAQRLAAPAQKKVPVTMPGAADRQPDAVMPPLAALIAPRHTGARHNGARHNDRIGPLALSAWHHAQSGWRRARAMPVAVIGAALVLVAVVAVLSSGAG